MGGSTAAVEDAFGLDVVGLGALNVDLIATRSGAHDDPVEDTETPATIEEIVARLAPYDLVAEAFLGGSAFNALVMLAQLRTELRLGMVGVSSARTDGVAESHRERLAALGIVDLTRLSERRPGLCLALSEQRARLLRTAPEANLEIVDHLDGNEELVEAVASARVLHLTSLLEDPTDPRSRVAESVASFVERAKAVNPRLVLSFDPGRTWVDGLHRLPDLRRVYALADVLYVSPHELAHLSTGRHSRRGHQASLQGLCADETLVVVKPMHAIVIRLANGMAVARLPRLDRSLAVDPTGAGDGVAAGVLAALGASRSVVDGCRLGLRIAAQRVSDFGDRGHGDLRHTLGDLWDPGPSVIPTGSSRGT